MRLQWQDPAAFVTAAAQNFPQVAFYDPMETSANLFMVWLLLGVPEWSPTTEIYLLDLARPVLTLQIY